MCVCVCVLLVDVGRVLVNQQVSLIWEVGGKKQKPCKFRVLVDINIGRGSVRITGMHVFSLFICHVTCHYFCNTKHTKSLALQVYSVCYMYMLTKGWHIHIHSISYSLSHTLPGQ